jgi:hypothetical protein
VPARLDNPTIARIQELRAAGLSVRRVQAKLAAEGHAVSVGSIQGHATRAAPARPVGGALVAALQAKGKPAPPEAVPALDPTDDLAVLARRRDALDKALALWEPQLGAHGGAVRAYKGLVSELGAITARLVELRPRPVAEAERLEVLGASARDKLLERAAAEAAPGELAWGISLPKQRRPTR